MGDSAALSGTDNEVLAVLLRHQGKVVSRATIARQAGIGHLHPRRPDAAVAAIRKVFGEGSVVTVRGRGWMLVPGATTELRPEDGQSL